MNIKIIKLLLAICAVLMVVLVAEWLAAKIALNRLLESDQSASSRSYPIDDVPTVELAGKTEEHYVDLVSRPLFIQGRRPVAETGPEQGTALPGSDTFDWQLIGVYTVKDNLSALFSREKNPVPKDNFRKLREGGDLDGWKVAEIHKDKVVLSQPGSETKVLLLRKPKPKQLPKTQEPVQNQVPARQRLQRRVNPPVPADPPVSEPQISEEVEDAPENSDNE